MAGLLDRRPSESGPAATLPETVYPVPEDQHTLVELYARRLPADFGVQEARLYLLEDGSLAAQDGEQVPELAAAGGFCEALRRAGRTVPAAQLSLPAPPELGWGQAFAPLLHREDLVGLLVLGARPAGSLTEPELTRIDLLLRQAALAYASLRLESQGTGLARWLLAEEEDRRKQAAAELHDIVLQNLFFVKNRLPEETGSGQVAAILDESIRQLRGTLRGLRPPQLNQSLDLALADLVEELQQKTGHSPEILWECALEDPLEIQEARKTAIYRIAQEAVTNAVKHANAQAIRVSLSGDGRGAFRLSITDDGRGIGAADGRAPGHYGLRAMAERARMIAADLKIESAAGAGTRLTLSFPGDEIPSRKPSAQGDQEARSEFDCPVCGQQDLVQALPVIVAGGTGHSRQPGLRSEGSTVTELARQLAPPAEPRPLARLTLPVLLVLTILSVYLTQALFSLVYPALMILLSAMLEAGAAQAAGVFSLLIVMAPLPLAVFSFLALRAAQLAVGYGLYRRRRPVWERRMARWSRLFFCHRDGIVFDPSSRLHGDPGQLAALLEPA